MGAIMAALGPAVRRAVAVNRRSVILSLTEISSSGNFWCVYLDDELSMDG